jgi:hypothetical protein
MEEVGFDRQRIVSSIHAEANNHMKGNQPKNSVLIKDVMNSFKISILRWQADKIETFVGDDANRFATRILVCNKQGGWIQW